jgi:hypothetical protein
MSFILSKNDYERYLRLGSVGAADELQFGQSHMCMNGLDGSKAGQFRASAVLDPTTNERTGQVDLLLTYTYGHPPGSFSIGRMEQVSTTRALFLLSLPAHSFYRKVAGGLVLWAISGVAGKIWCDTVCFARSQAISKGHFACMCVCVCVCVCVCACVCVCCCCSQICPRTALNLSVPSNLLARPDIQLHMQQGRSPDQHLEAGTPTPPAESLLAGLSRLISIPFFYGEWCASHGMTLCIHASSFPNLSLLNTLV